MKTLLTLSQTTALIGDSDGNIHTESLPTGKSYGEMESYLYLEYKEAGHTNKDAEYIDAPRVGALRPTEDFRVNNLEINAERIPIKMYTDEVSGLSVRAAFDPKTSLWVVADYEPDENDSE